MYGKYLSGHTSLVLRPIKVLLLLLFPAFEELHDNIKFVIIGCTQWKLFKEMTGKVNANKLYVLFYKCCNVSSTRKHENDINTDGWGMVSHIK